MTSCDQRNVRAAGESQCFLQIFLKLAYIDGKPVVLDSCNIVDIEIYVPQIYIYLYSSTLIYLSISANILFKNIILNT